MSSESWKDWVTTRRREYSARAKSAPPISENGSSFWVVAPISGQVDALLFQGCLSDGAMWNTPRVGIAPGGGSPNSKDFKFRLENQVQPLRQWATPRAGKIDSEDLERWIERNRTNNGKTGCPLPLQVEIEAQPTPHQEGEAQQWATPRASKIHAENPVIAIARAQKHGFKFSCLATEAVMATPPPEGEINIVGNRPASPAKLNPRWVETLMGLPIGWTMPSCQEPWIIVPMNYGCSEMESYQTPPHEPLEYYGDSLPTNSKKDKDT
jgi:hypothetical protein